MQYRAALCYLLISICVFISPAIATEYGENLDLELGVNEQGFPLSWFGERVQPATGGVGYSVELDTGISFSGKQSARLRFESGHGGPSAFGCLAQSTTPDPFLGKRARLTAQLRSEKVASHCGIWMRIDADNGTMVFDNMETRPVAGTNDWQQVSVVLDVPQNAKNLTFGSLLSGQGTVWVDDFHLDIVGSDVPTTAILDNTANVVTTKPTPEQQTWLTKNANTFTTVEAGNNLADLKFLDDLVADARIVSLGECTHGSREVFQMKHRLIEYLATEKGFTLFSIEASTPEAYLLNDYVLGGDGDPAKLIGGMYFWTWNTEEVLDLVEWMREFNLSGKGKIQFTGFDMQTSKVALANVANFLSKANNELTVTFKEKYQPAFSRTKPSNFGVCSYRFPIEEARGKTAIYRGEIKTEDVKNGYAGLWWRIDGPDKKMLGFDNMKNRGAKGTTDWTEYTISMDVPAEAKGVVFGAIMPASGKAWFDDLTIELDGQISDACETFDLGFEGKSITTGYYSNTSAFRASLTAEHAYSGKQSLLLESLENNTDNQFARAETARLAKELLTELQAQRESFLLNNSSQEVAWVIHNARIIEQCMRSRVGKNARSVRDLSMAENVAWILEQNPNEKIILWAHNAHVSRTSGMMGKHLHDWFGADYLPIGFATARGTYYATRGSSGSHIHKLTVPVDGSIEEFMVADGRPNLLVDLRLAKKSSLESGWLLENRPMRSLGAMPSDQQFWPAVTADLYDALIFIDETKAAIQLKTPTASAR